MTIVKISVPITGAERDDAALSTAFQLSQALKTHVEVLFVHRDPREVVSYSQLTLRPDIVQNLVDTEVEIQNDASHAARRDFSAAAAEYNVKIVGAPLCTSVATANYREAMGHFSQVMARESLLSDLVVFPPILNDDPKDIHDAFVKVLIGAGRPVVLSAAKKPVRIGRRVAIGWDGRSAAAHALFAALPILETAEAVNLLTIGSVSRDGCSAQEARHYLELHEIDCLQVAIEGGLRPIAEQLLEATTNSNSDLLVLGGYGHSRMAESVFGGVTEDMVSHPEIPILMMH